jgi:hypothetical protein
LDQAEEVIKASRRERQRLRSSGRVNPLPTIKAKLKQVQKANDYTKTEGIPESEIARIKTAGECLGCAWLSDRKETHRVKHCRRLVRLEKGTACFPKAKGYVIKDDTSEEDHSSEEDSSSKE